CRSSPQWNWNRTASTTFAFARPRARPTDRCCGRGAAASPASPSSPSSAEPTGPSGPSSIELLPDCVELLRDKPYLVADRIVRLAQFLLRGEPAGRALDRVAQLLLRDHGGQKLRNPRGPCVDVLEELFDQMRLHRQETSGN